MNHKTWIRKPYFGFKGNKFKLAFILIYTGIVKIDLLSASITILNLFHSVLLAKNDRRRPVGIQLIKRSSVVYLLPLFNRLRLRLKEEMQTLLEVTVVQMSKQTSVTWTDFAALCITHTNIPEYTGCMSAYPTFLFVAAFHWQLPCRPHSFWQGNFSEKLRNLLRISHWSSLAHKIMAAAHALISRTWYRHVTLQKRKSVSHKTIVTYQVKIKCP